MVISSQTETMEMLATIETGIQHYSTHSCFISYPSYRISYHEQDRGNTDLWELQDFRGRASELGRTTTTISYKNQQNISFQIYLDSNHHFLIIYHQYQKLCIYIFGVSHSNKPF